MKKNDWLLLISVALYSLLFYQQSAGINYFIFNIVLITFLVLKDREVLKSRVWLSVAVSALLSSFFIFIYSSPLSIVANIFSLAVISALSFNAKTSIITSLFLTFISTAGSYVFMIMDWTERKKREIESTVRPVYVKILLFVIPFLISLIFFFLYRSVSPFFYDFTKDINLDFISFSWIFFTLGGLFLMYGFFYNKRLPDLVNKDVNAPNDLSGEMINEKGFLNTFMRIDTENLSGIILFLMLNSLLLIMNVLDLRYLWLDGTLPKDIMPKDFVHQGVGLLITSILIAIAIILFYFRGGLNFFEKNKAIRIMAFIWIIQNAFMIFSAAYRNNMYIDESGLSYKKIGVYVYLLLTLIGLVTTYIKVKKIKTNWFLFRSNSMIWYYILVISCVFNWDVFITQFNINKHMNEKKPFERYLMVDLSFKNLPQLMALPDSVIKKDDMKARDYYSELREVYFESFESGLNRKLYYFLEEYDQLEWQSFCLEKKRIYHAVFSKRDQVKRLNLNNVWGFKLKPIIMFDELTELDISNCGLESIDDLKNFTHIEKLNISGNTFTDYSVLKKLLALTKVNVGAVTSIQYEDLHTMLPNVEILYTIR